MGYYVRTFCTSDRIPSIKEILDWAASQGCKLSLDEYSQDVDITSSDWEQVGILYKVGKLSFLAEVNRDDGTEDCLLKSEVEEFKEFLSEKRDFLNFGKKKVLNHLDKTKYIIANQLPTSDIDNDGFNANGIFLQYFVKNCGGMIQADGEGFYEGNRLIVKLD